MYLLWNPCSESLLTFRFTGPTQHDFVLKFHPTFLAHYPPTSPKLPPHYVSSSLTVPIHFLPPFPPCHLTPPIHLSRLPSSLLSHLSQLISLPTTNRCLQNGNVDRVNKTRVTNSQEATHESWMVRCSPHAPRFGQRNHNERANEKFFELNKVLEYS